VPLNDLREHEIQGTMCWCNPRVEWRDVKTGAFMPEAVVIHHAADCREAVEEAEQILREMQ